MHVIILVMFQMQGIRKQQPTALGGLALPASSNRWNWIKHETCAKIAQVSYCIHFQRYGRNPADGSRDVVHL